MNQADLPQVSVGAESHIGTARENNEDALSVRSELGLWVVADGMGGAAAGEVASALAVEEIVARVARGEGLVEAIQGAHRAILAAPARGRGSVGMGTTVVALRLHPNSYELAWVGDSRAYLFREGKLRQLSRDHSLVQSMVDRGEITPQEARFHPHRNIITRVLGALESTGVMSERVGGTTHRGDVLLLCTDGLNGEIDDETISAVLSAAEGPQKAAERLVEAALSAGGQDNITALVVAVDQDPER
ncbi:MAG: protein phosphatase 2C domain-containing protein [Pseudomonadota bacterium]